MRGECVVWMPVGKLPDLAVFSTAKYESLQLMAEIVGCPRRFKFEISVRMRVL